MKHPKILVTGATGRTGGEVVRQLRALDWPVRALVHVSDARSRSLERIGAEVVVADLFDPEHLRQAMRGVGRAYYCPPFHLYMIQSAVAFAVAAREARLESLVGLTQWLASPSHPSISTRQHWLVDRMFSMLPETRLTIVNPGLFAEYPYMALFDFAAQLGIFPMPGDGDSRNAPPSIADIARVSVAALVDPDRHAGKTYRPTGPELLSIREMVAIISRVLGRRVRHLDLPMWMFYKAARIDGTSKVLLDGFRYYVREHSRGAFEMAAPNTVVLEVTGRPAESFESIVRRHAAMPENMPTLANRLRAFASFMSVPMRPGFNPQRYERAQALPTPDAPHLAVDDDQWTASRSTGAAVPPVPPAMLGAA